MKIHTIKLSLANCYLLEAQAGFVLVDSGASTSRPRLEKGLENAGCRPGGLNLVIATHGDADHVGSSAYLRQRYATKLAMHPADVEAAQTGDATLIRKFPHSLGGSINKAMLRLFTLKPEDRFTPDILLEDGDNLSAYGVDAQVVHIAVHSNGSIGLLTPEGAFLCGDLFVNYSRPAPGPLIFGRQAFKAALAKLDQLNIHSVYPGHGKPFAWEQYEKPNRTA
ncbi:MAG: MBL fold metallo-hydrolase [Chloroflexota bacterium]